MDEFNAAYYSTMAQVIPALFIAAIATRYFARRPRGKAPTLDPLVVVMVLIVTFGETFALDALYSREEGTWVSRSVMTLAAVFPLMLVGAEVAADPARAVVAGLRNGQVLALATGLVVVPTAVVIITLSSGNDGARDFLAGALMIALVAAGTYAVRNDLRAARRRRAKRSPR